MKNKILEVLNISKSYSKTEILKDLNFTLFKNEITTISGLNGQGKTTILKIISTITQVEKGQILYNQQKLIRNNFITFIPELPYFAEEFTSKEAVQYFLSLENKKLDMEKFNYYSKILNLVENKKIIKNFSKGTRQKLGVIMSALSSAELVLLDEPYSGLDISGQYELKQIITEMKKNGKTILLTSHNLEFSYDVSDRILVLNHGEIKKDFYIKDLCNFNEFKKILEKEFLNIND